MDTKARIALPLLALCALAACGKNPDALFQSAKESFAQQDYQTARGNLISALSKRPDDPAMLTLLARVQIGLGDTEGAGRSLGRLEHSGANTGTLRLLKARLALLQGAPDQALALIGDDRTMQACLVRAQAHLARGDQARAKQEFEQGMAAGNDIELASAYGRFALRQQDHVLAGRILQRMQAMSAVSYETVMLTANLAAEQGKTQQAIAAYRSIIAAHPDRVEPLLALASQLEMKNQLQEAGELVDQAGKLDPANTEAEDLRYQILAEQGEWEKIRLGLQGRESSLDPTSNLGMRYAEALLRLGFAQQARLMFKRAALLLPGNPYTRMMLGEAQLASGDPNGAWETLQPLSASILARPEVLQSAVKAASAIGAPEVDDLRKRLEPGRMKRALALIDRGDAAIVRRDWQAASQVYGVLLEQGDDPEVLKRLALAADGLGRSAEAIGYADRTLALSPDNPDYLYLAGHVRLNANLELTKARSLLEAAASSDPRNEIIAGDLKKAKAAAG